MNLLNGLFMTHEGENAADVFFLNFIHTCSVYLFFVSAAPLVDTSENQSGSAMLMLLSVVVVGLAVFIIYKFKR